MKKRNWIIASLLASTIGIAGLAQACDAPREEHGDHMMHVMKKLDLTKITDTFVRERPCIDETPLKTKNDNPRYRFFITKPTTETELNLLNHSHLFLSLAW